MFDTRGDGSRDGKQFHYGIRFKSVDCSYFFGIPITASCMVGMRPLLWCRGIKLFSPELANTLYMALEEKQTNDNINGSVLVSEAM